MIDVRCRAVPFQGASKVGPVIARVGERIGLCVRIERIVGERRFHTFKRDSTLEAKLRGSPGEGCDCASPLSLVPLHLPRSQAAVFHERFAAPLMRARNRSREATRPAPSQL